MTPEAGFYLAKARRLLDQADGMLAMNYHDAAGRTAYLAAFHAAQALIFDRTGRAVKTHKGVNAELHRVIRGDTRIDSELRAFLSFAYTLKAIADYETDPDSDVSFEVAAAAVATGKRFVATMTELIGAAE